ncbi:GT4 family glycosyltransferase PelF [Chitinivorax sp. PXF-14]|uniref:GT4 family glycosyltransferase PelF n=1 Tax=Chitinivorax sp. PXF-14 TaxID=3230488 RepID=UPI003467CC6E
MTHAPYPKAASADIAMLLEGTFPFVSGGVSSWVNQIIRAFPDYTFALIFIGSRPEDYGQPKYELPPNVVHLETHYIHTQIDIPLIRRQRGDPATFGDVEAMHEYFRAPHASPDGANAFERLSRELLPGGKLDRDTFLFSEASWDFIKTKYREHSIDPSFVDFFWTIRAMHQPIWTMAQIAESLPEVRAFHTISTGYAGFLGALLKRRRGRPLILSEHGIYTKERKIDLFQSEWITDNRNVFQKDPTEISYFRQLWMRLFESFGKLCYDAADDIIALYEANRQRQIQDGAEPARTRNIPNGINLKALSPLRQQRPAETPPILCLIGRVVPIKDIKTFIRAMRTVVNRIPQAEGWIAGPEDESPEYAEECKNLVISLGLEKNVKFLGFQKIPDLLPKIGLMVLSSISEALPLVILEGYAAGVPTISTDVGSCRQLVYGFDDADRAIGASGRIVGIADPLALANAAIELLLDPAAWQAASQAAIERVERYYTQDMMFGQYRSVYERALSLPVPSLPGAAGQCPRRG